MHCLSKLTCKKSNQDLLGSCRHFTYMHAYVLNQSLQHAEFASFNIQNTQLKDGRVPAVLVHEFKTRGETVGQSLARTHEERFKEYSTALQDDVSCFCVLFTDLNLCDFVAISL